MTKKLKKDKNGLVFHINQSIADDLGINEKTDFELIIIDDSLILRPKNPEIIKKQLAKRSELTERLMDELDPVLKKLAKT